MTPNEIILIDATLSEKDAATIHELIATREQARRIAVYLEGENARLTAMIDGVRALADEYANNADAAPSLLLYAKDISKDIHNALDDDE